MDNYEKIIRDNLDLLYKNLRQTLIACCRDNGIRIFSVSGPSGGSAGSSRME